MDKQDIYVKRASTRSVGRSRVAKSRQKKMCANSHSSITAERKGSEILRRFSETSTISLKQSDADNEQRSASRSRSEVPSKLLDIHSASPTLWMALKIAICRF